MYTDGKKFYYIYVFLIVTTTTFVSFHILESRNVWESQDANYIQGSVENALTEKNEEFHKLQEVAVDKQINSYGFYDEDWQKEKDKDTYRIAALGDSMTAGVKIRNNETWPEHLERILNEKRKKPDYEVLNMGQPGDIMYGKYQTLQDFVLKFNPDMLILQYYGNDWQSPHIRDKATDKFEKWKSGDYQLPKEVEEKIESQNIPNHIVEVTVRSIVRENYKEKTDKEKEWNKWVKPYLMKITEKARKKDIKFLIITWDSINWQMEKLEELTEEHNVPLYDFSDKVPVRKKEYRLPDGHLNGLGYEVVANATYEKMKGRVG